ncbi:MAG: methyltransferase family protein [Planctomycetota bacterium]
MTIDRFFDWFGFGALVCLAFLALPRAILLYKRGIRVLVVDRQRTPGQILVDLLAMICLLLWSYELIACAWSVKFHFVPPRLAVVLLDITAIKIVGALLMVAGVAVYGLGTRGLGESWRLGIDRKKPGPLMNEGIFACSRNPIYVGFNLMFFGTFLIHGRLHLFLIALTFALMLHLIIRREERFLTERYGDAFAAYCARTGRYITWPMKKRV